MGTLVNLNKYRKQKSKIDAGKTAATNIRLHGRTTVERTREEAEKQRVDATLDGARLDGDSGEGDGSD
jgi:hypothetical protein